MEVGQSTASVLSVATHYLEMNCNTLILMQKANIVCLKLIHQMFFFLLNSVVAQIC